MYSLIVKGKDVQELKEQLKCLYEALGTPEESPSVRLPIEDAKKLSMSSMYGHLPIPPVPVALAPQPTHNMASAIFPVAPPQLPQAPSTEVPGFDKRGMPWDDRVHSSTKALNKDGTWRSKRGIDPREVARIESTLTTTNGHQPFHPTFVPPPVPPTTVDVKPPVFAQPPPPPPAPVPAQQAPKYQDPILPPPDAQKAAHTLETFKANFTPVMAELITSKKLKPDYVEQLKQYFGVQEIWEVFTNDAAVAEIFENFAAAGFITKV